MDAPEVDHAEGAKHRLPWEAAGAVRGHLVTLNQEVSDASASSLSASDKLRIFIAN